MNELESAPDHPGPLPRSRDEDRFVREGAILDALVDLSDSLVADYDPLDFLYRLIDHSLPLTDAQDAAVLLVVAGRLHLVASSSERAETISVLQLQANDGPALDAYASGEAVHAAQIAQCAKRWPQFTGAAESFGWRSTYAVPLRLREHVVGSFLVVWSDCLGARPTGAERRLLRAFADVATIAVLQHRATADVTEINDQLHRALESRITIEQAKGMVAQATGLDLGEAFELIRHHARSNNQKLRDVACSLVAGVIALAPPSDGSHASSAPP